LIPPSVDPLFSLSRNCGSLLRYRVDDCTVPESAAHHASAVMNPASLFHPAIAAWFDRNFTAPTPAQAQAWPAIQAGRHTLIAAPTGSGKTLAAFLAAIDALLRQGLAGRLENETQVVYVSPLKALSNDVHRNLEIPLA
jgi:ATP-dependent helicase Lhr and Lhr-like helicase